MSIERNLGMYTAVCDVCCEETLQPLFDFWLVVEQKKEAGWKSRKTGELGDDGRAVWEDVCTACLKLAQEALWVK